MTLTLRYPAAAPVNLPTFLATLTDPQPHPALTVGDDRMVAFLADFARTLRRSSVTKVFPELTSLAYFLRANELTATVERLHRARPNALAMPRGLVFHVPPANVDTVFAYSWALSALMGNVNVVRISERSGGAATAILDALNDTEADPVVVATQRMITYDRDNTEITAALSRLCDLRVIWGGDNTVKTIRNHPLAPSARDVAFPDRTSFAVLSIESWQRASTLTRVKVAKALANAVYTFDQAACSSPRAVFLIGNAASADAVRAELVTRVLDALKHRPDPPRDAAMGVQNLVSTYGLAADGAANELVYHANTLTEVALTSPAAMPRHWLAPGVFAFAHVPTLADLAPLVQRRDQTLGHFGFTREELTAFARTLGGRGIDRMVPFGQMLAFSDIWDGYDLASEFTRLVTITT